jgi:hypothetical protein
MMATKRKSGKRERKHSDNPPSQADSEAEDIALAEEILRVGREDQPILAAGFKRFLKQLGIKGKPIGAKRLREMLIKRGFNPEGNEFSQGIIDMREE